MPHQRSSADSLTIVSSSSNSSHSHQEQPILPSRPPRHQHSDPTKNAPVVGQLNFNSVQRSPPAKLSYPRPGPRPVEAQVSPSGIAPIDYADRQEAGAVVSVTAPQTKFVSQSVPAFRRDPYSQDYSVVQVQPMHVLVEVPVVASTFNSTTVNSGAKSTLRPPLVPAPRSSQLQGTLSQDRGLPVPALCNLQLSTLRSQQQFNLATPRSGRLNSARSSGESPHTGRSDRACGLSSVGETPRSARTNPTPRSARSDLSTPRDLPESVDGPYRNLGGLGVDPQPGEVVHLTPRQEANELLWSPRRDMVEMMPANAQGRTMPLPPAGTLHQELMTVVDFCKYPTRAFPLTPESESPPKEEMVRMFIGQLPYNVTDMQLGWMAYAFGGGVQLHHFERITKLDRTKRKQLPTGCFHFYVEPQYVDSLMVGVHKKLLVDDTGIWVAKDEKQDRILKTYSEQMKNDRTKRFEGRPYGTVVIQHSTSSFGLGGNK